MRVEIGPELTFRLHQAAKQQGLSVEQLVERILTSYLDARMEDLWVWVTQQRLPGVWSPEGFSRWRHPGRETTHG